MKKTSNGKTSSNFWLTKSARQKIRDIRYAYDTKYGRNIKISDVVNLIIEPLSVEDVVKLLPKPKDD